MAVVVGDRLEQLAQRQHLAVGGVALRCLVVEVGPRALPRGEVELVELGKVHRRHQPDGRRRTPAGRGRGRTRGGRRRSAGRRTRAPPRPRRAPSRRPRACARPPRGCCRGARPPAVGCGALGRGGCAAYDAWSEHGTSGGGARCRPSGSGVSARGGASRPAPGPPVPARAGPRAGSAGRPDGDPSTPTERAKSQNQSSPGSKLCITGCPVASKCAVACWAGLLSQHPTWPHCAHRRRCTHQPPDASHSTQPGPDGATSGSMPAVVITPECPFSGRRGTPSASAPPTPGSPAAPGPSAAGPPGRCGSARPRARGSGSSPARGAGRRSPRAPRGAPR